MYTLDLNGGLVNCFLPMRLHGGNKIPAIPNDIFQTIVSLCQNNILHENIKLFPNLRGKEDNFDGIYLVTKDFILPTIAGRDIGNGAMVIQTDVHKDEIDKKKLFDLLLSTLPISFTKDNKIKIFPQLEISLKSNRNLIPVSAENKKIIKDYVGAIGNNTNFVDIRIDRQNKVWIIIKSGAHLISRMVYNYFKDAAREYNKKWNTTSLELPYIPSCSYLGQQYMEEVKILKSLGKQARIHLLEIIKNALEKVTGDKVGMVSKLDLVSNSVSINKGIAYNVITHRRGLFSPHSETSFILTSPDASTFLFQYDRSKAAEFKFCHAAEVGITNKSNNQGLNPDLLHNLNNRHLKYRQSHSRNPDVVYGEQPFLYKLKELFPFIHIRS